MKSLKLNGLQRLLSFVLIAVLLICVVGFAAGGWQAPPDEEPDSGNVGNATDETDENKDGNNKQDDVDQGESGAETLDPPKDDPPIETPKYYSPITGLEISETQSQSVPIGFVLDTRMPLYGISGADLTLEFPTESGNTRLLAYTTNYNMLWKVGSIAPTRAFISSSSNFFGGMIVSYGSDNIVKYSAWDASKVNLDLSKISGSYYVENTHYIYTSQELVNDAKTKNPSLTPTGYTTAPFNFSDEAVLGATKAMTVVLPYSDLNETELYYSESSGQYLYFKSGIRKIDMLNGKNVSFTNVFVLFANSTTYEKAEGTELVIDTTGGGYGYYVSKGYMSEIRWSVDENGSLEFKTLSGERLTVNKGNSYIGYYKASRSSDVCVG